MDRHNSITDSTNGTVDDFAPAIGGASGLIVQDSKVLLIRRLRPPYAGFWSLPSGGVERGECLRDAVRREVFEETGLAVEVRAIAGFREYLSADSHYVIPAFFCTVIWGELRVGDDVATAEFVEPREALARRLVPALEDVFRDAGLID